MATKHRLAFSNIISPPTSHYSDSCMAIPNFTATGRPLAPSESKHGSGLISLGSADCVGPADHLPRRYTDDSMISIPVLPPSSMVQPSASTSPVSPTSPICYSSVAANYESPVSPISPVYPNSLSSTDPIKYDTPSSLRSSFKFWKARHTPTSTSGQQPPRKSSLWSRSTSIVFTMKQVTRGEYLKHYAKDDQGRYIGTEDPAEDCILRDVRDVARWRSSVTWTNEVGK